MQLHNLQIVINASNAVNKYQNAYQHQPAAAQAQEALQYNEEVEKRMSQARETEERPSSKNVDESDEKFRQWKKDPPADEKKETLAQKEKKKEEDVRNRMSAGRDHIIDIRA